MCCFFFQAEDGIRDLVRSRGLGDVYKRQNQTFALYDEFPENAINEGWNNDLDITSMAFGNNPVSYTHLTLPTSDLV